MPKEVTAIPITEKQFIQMVTEKQFARMVIDAALLLGWKVYHTWASIHSPSGFPDLVLIRPPRLIFAELKREGMKPTPAQAEWLEALRGCQWPYMRVELWHPSDWDAIIRTLGR